MSPPEDPVPRDALRRFAVALGDRASLLFVAATLITVFEVLARYLFAAPTTWAHVTTTALCAVAFAFGGAYAMAQDQHIRITSVVQHFRPRARHACELLAAVCGVLYLAGLSYAAVQQAWEAVWHFEGARWVPEPVPGPPHWPLPALVRTALALGAILFLLTVVRHLFQLLRSRPR